MNGRVLNRIQKLAMSAEHMVAMVRVAAQAGDIERIYEAMDVPIPDKIRVATFLVFQFETLDFNFKHGLRKECELQEKYEEMQKEEVLKICGDKGIMALKQAYPNDYGERSEESELESPPPNLAKTGSVLSRRSTINSKSPSRSKTRR